MSRIGKLPINLESDIQVEVTKNNEIIIKKAQRSLKVPVSSNIEIQLKDSQIILKRKNDEQKTRAFHGLYRSLIQNAVTGFSKNWKKTLKFNGVGYKASVSGQKLEMNLGYSKPISFDIPDGIEIKVEKQTQVSISGVDRQQVGQIAAQIRSLRPPEPYLGKGVRYIDEVIRKKSGKSGAEKK